MIELIKAALNSDSDPINRARINILTYIGLFSIVLCVFLAVAYAVYGPPFQFIRVLVVLSGLIIGMRELLKSHNYKPTAHIVIILFNVLVWSNILFIIQAINIVTVQYIILGITCSFYLLNRRWGIFYSFTILFPVLLYFIRNGVGHAQVTVNAQQASDPIFVALLMFNFLQIIFINYHFLHAFNLSLGKLEESQKEERVLNDQLKQAIRLAESSSKAKSDFLSTMSHELRTPLNSVIGMSYVLMAENPRKDQEENIKILHFSAESLLALINDILDFNKLDYGKLELEEIGFYPSDLIKNLYSGLKYQSDEKGLDFKLTLDDNLNSKGVIGDPTRLLQILYNLVGNAIKFTPKGKIFLSVKLLEENEESIKLGFIIRDTGIGIEKGKSKIIFEPFSQASSNITREFGGSGLGLAITRQLLELHGSGIEMESEKGIGTSFKFDIVYKLADKDQIAVHPIFSTGFEQELDLARMALLVAEDNTMNVLLMKKLLSGWNVNADYVENGLEAVQKAEEKSYDIILMDIHMPVMDGYEATGRILEKYGPDKKRPLIIALTASVATDVQQKIRAVGMDDYVSKPFNPVDLKNKLLSLLRQKHQNDQGVV